MIRIETPEVRETSGGYALACKSCSFKRFSLNIESPAVHLCNDHQVVRWIAVELKGQKTSPLSEGYLAILAKKNAVKAKR